MLAHFVDVEDLADSQRNLSSAAQRIALALDAGPDGSKILLSGCQQLFTLARTLGGEIRIAAHHQPLTRIIRRRHRSHVARVEQRELYGTAVQQFLDRRSAQRADPVQSGRSDVRADACLSDHTAVADQHHVLEAEALLELVDLW